jgi:peptidoglycan hydrolase-like protein with peptidoglycan-binding domain
MSVTRLLLSIAMLIGLLTVPAIGSPDAASASVAADPIDDLTCPISDIGAKAHWNPGGVRGDSFSYVMVDQCSNIRVRASYDSSSQFAQEVLSTSEWEVGIVWRCSEDPWTFQKQPPTCSVLLPPESSPEGLLVLGAKSQRAGLPLSAAPLALISRQTLNGQLQNAIKALGPYDPAKDATPTPGPTSTPTPAPAGGQAPAPGQPTATPTPAAAPRGVAAAKPQTSSSTLPTVKAGDTGNAVTAIQYLLRQAGQDIDADGDFGPVTEQAVRDFQKAKGLTVDGVVGTTTWTALFVSVKQGDQGDAVSAAQTLLAAQGQDIAVDGDFGDQTDGAVRAFQKAKGLTVDGIVGSQTWTALLAAG